MVCNLVSYEALLHCSVFSTAQSGFVLLSSSTTFTDDGTVALISGTPPVSNESGGGHIDTLSHVNMKILHRDLRL